MLLRCVPRIFHFKVARRSLPMPGLCKQLRVCGAATAFNCAVSGGIVF